MSCTSNRRAVSLAPFTSINRWFLTVLAVLSLSASALVAATAPAATAVPPGIVRGKIQNASNGTMLENATVSVVGTNKQAITNGYGEYELRDVPAGEVTLKASYVGEPDQKAAVTVLGGVSIDQDFIFRQTAATKFNKDGTIVLDPFMVQTERFKNAREIAVAEERTSVNIKNVVSTDAFGDIPSGNVGEFVKFLPGVQLSYGNYGGSQSGTSENTASGISIRGFGPEDTAIMIDGMPVSNAAPGTLSRQVGLDMLSITNASRVELTKVATPDMPANSIGGSVNLITKNAFEYAHPEYNVGVYFNFNSLSTSLGKTEGPVNKSTYKTTPGLDFSVSYPVSKTFGFSITGHAAQEYDLNYHIIPTWGMADVKTTISSVVVHAQNSSGIISITNPMLNRVQVTDDPRMVDQTSANIKLDWRPTPSQTISANFQYSDYTGVEAQRKLDIKIPVAPVAASVSSADWGPTYTTGLVGNTNGTTNMTVTTIDKAGNTKSGYLTYKLELGGWNIYAAGSISQSTGRYIDQANGHYSGIDMQASTGRVDFTDIQDGVPFTINTYKKNSSGGAQFDYTNLSTWTVSNPIAQSAASYSQDTIGLYRLDVERALDFIPFLRSNSLTFKTGARRDQHTTEKYGLGTGYRDVLAAGKTFTTTDIIDTTYVGHSPGFGIAPQQWISTYKLWEQNQANQLFVAPTDGADAVANWNSYQSQQKYITETTDAFYAMLSGKFFHNRLSFVGGARQESNSRVGRGPFTDSKWNYAKYANGTLYTEAVGPYATGVKFDNATFLTDTALLGRLKAAGISAPDHVLGPTASSLESDKLNRIANHQVNDKLTGKPSEDLSASFDLTKKIALKAAWSRTFGLPALENGTNGILSGNGAFTANPNSPIPADGTEGTIAVANPGLPPSISNNLDFQVSYYTDTGGKFAVSYYTKAVTNQPMTFSTYSGNPLFNTLLDALGLDETAYANWKINTSTVSSTIQKTHGYEFEVQQDFGFLGAWGRHVQVFATYTLKSLAAPATPVPYYYTPPIGAPVLITPAVTTINMTANRLATGGIQFSTERFSAQIRGAWRNDNEEGSNRLDLGGGNFLRRIEPAETRIDVNASYRLSKRYSVYVSGKDVFNAKRDIIIRDDFGQLPAYAQTFDKKQFGITWTVGVKGTF